jgi:hypothetical protein
MTIKMKATCYFLTNYNLYQLIQPVAGQIGIKRHFYPELI